MYSRMKRKCSFIVLVVMVVSLSTYGFWNAGTG